MIGPTGAVRVMVATRPVDFRKGADGLAALVRETMGADPFSGAIYVFRAIAELNRRITETDQRLNRLYDAIEAGIADLNDAALKDRVAALTAIRDQARADAERAQAALDSATNRSITPQMVETFAEEARRRIRLPGGGYRRDHLRALAQRVEVADKEVRIMGSRSTLLQTLTAVSSVESARLGVQSSVLKWRTRRVSNS